MASVQDAVKKNFTYSRLRQAIFYMVTVKSPATVALRLRWPTFDESYS